MPGPTDLPSIASVLHAAATDPATRGDVGATEGSTGQRSPDRTPSRDQMHLPHAIASEVRTASPQLRPRRSGLLDKIPEDGPLASGVDEPTVTSADRGTAAAVMPSSKPPGRRYKKKFDPRWVVPNPALPSSTPSPAMEAAVDPGAHAGRETGGDDAATTTTAESISTTATAVRTAPRVRSYKKVFKDYSHSAAMLSPVSSQLRRQGLASTPREAVPAVPAQPLPQAPRSPRSDDIPSTPTRETFPDLPASMRDAHDE